VKKEKVLDGYLGSVPKVGEEFNWKKLSL